MSKASHIKQKDFEHFNISAIEDHAQKGSVLLAPFSKVPGPITFLSWKDRALPNVLWAAILAAHLDREHYLKLFRQVTIAAREKIADYAKTHVTHAHLANMVEGDFAIMMASVIRDPDAQRLLSALRLLESLPDRQHWQKVVAEPDPATAWDFIAEAIVACYDHQSEVSTDIRWFKLAHLTVMGKMHFPESKKEFLEELRLFPTKGDMRSVRPAIRAAEAATRMFETEQNMLGDVKPFPYDAFWAECYARTECIVVPNVATAVIDVIELGKELVDLSKNVVGHFYSVVETTDIDPRRDAAFGLIQYAISLAMEAASCANHHTVAGRLLLRSTVEAFITLRYLTSNDNPTFWAQYRSYGAGQAKLSFLKNLREDDVPAFIDLKQLQALANEDMWLEYQDIQLGSWAGSNLRKMAEACGCKDVYDKHYDWASGYAHGHWTSIRDAVFVTCMNPLHRFHRIPIFQTAPMPSVLRDCCSLINRMLDDLSSLFPTFKPRLKWHKPTAAKSDEKERVG